MPSVRRRARSLARGPANGVRAPIRVLKATPAFPFAVYAIVALNVVAFIYEASLPDEARQSFIDAWALVPYDLMHGIGLTGGPPAAATLASAQFLHASVPHVAINMLFLAAFGPEIEYLTGSLRFVAFYLCCGIVGGLAQVSIDPASHVPEVGASGAIAGVLGAYVLRHPTLPLVLGIPAFAVIGLWFAVQFVHGFGTLTTHVLSERGGGTAYFAHIGGFLAGVFTIGLWQVRAASPHGSIFRYYHR